MKRILRFFFTLIISLFLIQGECPWLTKGSSGQLAADQSASSTDSSDILQEARLAALSYASNLPDFTCLQITRRFERHLFQSLDWTPLGTIKAEVSFVSGKELYRILQSGGAGSGAEMEEQTGSVSKGEYGTIIKQIFDPASATIFKLEGKDKRNKRERVRFRFLIPKETSQYRLAYSEGSMLNQSTVVSWGGKIWIDLASKQVVSVASQALDLPLNFPFTAAKTDVDYDLRQVGSKEFWLPVHAEFNTITRNLPEMSTRMRSKEMKNVMEFSNYRKFSVDVQVKP